MLGDGMGFYDENDQVYAGTVSSTTQKLTVKPANGIYVASVTTGSAKVSFATLNSAIAYAEVYGGTLTLLQNITVTEPVQINSGNFEFNSGRYTLSGSLSGGVIEITGASVIFVANTGGLIQNTGTGCAISVTNGFASFSSGTIQASGNAVVGRNSLIGFHSNITVISTGAAAVWSDSRSRI